MLVGITTVYCYSYLYTQELSYTAEQQCFSYEMVLFPAIIVESS